MKFPILLISQGLVHPSLPARLVLRQALERSEEFSFRQVGSLESLPKLMLEQYRALVLYFHHKSLSASALDCLEGYLSRGGGCLAVHSVSASFKLEDRFTALLGGRFDHHAPVESFTVLPYLSGDRIFGEYAPFSLKDERYIHVYDPTNTIHFAFRSESGLEPLVWTRPYGQGRVCYVAAGHTLSSVRSPEIQRILVQGLRWCVGVTA